MSHRLGSLAVVALLAVALPAAAQTPLPVPPPGSADPGQVLSANPFGLLIDFFNSEYEIRASDAITVGAGASTRAYTAYDYDYSAPTAPGTFPSGVPARTERQKRYTNGDVFLRYYPGGRAFHGYSFGVKAGVTRLPNQGDYLGVGFDINHSRMLNRHAYLGSGFGLKRLIGADARAFDITYIPTLRINVGVGF
ncbi:MAG: hypothetical protein R2745_11430 [Vicinamibacterales bacterium]